MKQETVNTIALVGFGFILFHLTLAVYSVGKRVTALEAKIK